MDYNNLVQKEHTDGTVGNDPDDQSSPGVLINLQSGRFATTGEEITE